MCFMSKLCLVLYGYSWSLYNSWVSVSLSFWLQYTSNKFRLQRRSSNQMLPQECDGVMGWWDDGLMGWAKSQRASSYLPTSLSPHLNQNYSHYLTDALASRLRLSSSHVGQALLTLGLAAKLYKLILQNRIKKLYQLQVWINRKIAIFVELLPL